MDRTSTTRKEKNSSIANLTSIVLQYIEEHNLLPNHPTIVLGLSGGPDSVFLLHLLADLKKAGRIKEVIAAHLDHGWRADSQNDVDFSRQLAATCRVPFFADRLANFKNAIAWNGSKEDLGRKARRLFFKKVMKEYHADVIALAHHRDDQLETFFIRLIRGTSLTGLCGIRPKSGSYIRPLLSVSKQDIIDYLTTHQIPYVTDPSNLSPDYLRNRIRNTVLPPLRACDERFDTNSIKTIERLQHVEDYLVDQTKKLFDDMSEEQDGTIALAYNQLLAKPSFMQYRLLIEWLTRMKVPFPVTEQFLKEILRFFQAKRSKRHRIMQKWVLEKEKEWIRIHTI